MDIEWNRFDDGTLQGMESLIGDDLSACVIKYVNGEGFHWSTRSWDADGNCTVTGSYDFADTQDGWAFLSDAYRSLLSHLASIGILTDSESAAESSPSSVRRFLSKAMSLGFAAMVSLSALSGIASPVLAYADEASPSAGDIYVEMQDGLIGIYDADGFQSGDSINYVNDDGGFVEIQPGTELYDAVTSAMSRGFSDERASSSGLVGHISGVEGAQIIIDESSGMDRAEGSLPIPHDALRSVYEQYCNDGEMHPIQMHFYSDGEVVDVVRNWVRDEFGMEMDEFDSEGSGEVQIINLMATGMAIILVTVGSLFGLGFIFESLL